MLPARFNHYRPERLEEALALLARHGDDATPMAGGTELLIAMKARVLHYAHVVDIKRIRELHGVSLRPDGGLSIGALCTHHQLAHDPLVLAHLPAYAKLSANIANFRVRVAGTLGGNLCFAEPHADPPALLCALGAELVLVSAAGERRIALQDFIQGELSTARNDDEILVRVEVPPVAAGTRIGYQSFGHLERPAVGVAVAAVPEGEGYRWRVTAGALCGRPTSLISLQDALLGLPVREALAELGRKAPRAAAAIRAHDDAGGSADYKRHLVSVLAARVAHEVFDIAGV